MLITDHEQRNHSNPLSFLSVRFIIAQKTKTTTKKYCSCLEIIKRPSGMAELEQIKRFRLKTLLGHEVVPGTSIGIHKKVYSLEEGRAWVRSMSLFSSRIVFAFV